MDSVEEWVGIVDCGGLTQGHGASSITGASGWTYRCECVIA